jgi:FixJ family two-component response regulator
VPIAVHIVEDDASVRDAARELVAAEGRPVFSYRSPASFFAEASLGPTDIVVLDLHFPTGSGIEIAKRLRRDYPGVRIIIISGVRLGAYSQALAMIEPEGSFRKPLDAGAFADCVKKLAGT